MCIHEYSLLLTLLYDFIFVILLRYNSKENHNYVCVSLVFISFLERQSQIYVMLYSSSASRTSYDFPSYVSSTAKEVSSYGGWLWDSLVAV